MADGVGKTASSAQGTTIRGSEFASTMQNAQSEAPTEHIVVRGDTMHKIARQHNVQFNDLVGANPQFEQGRSVNRIYVGEHIQLPRGNAPRHADGRVHDTLPAANATAKQPAEPASKQAQTESAAHQVKAEPQAEKSSALSNAELKQKYQELKSEGLTISFSQYKDMQKIYAGEGDKTAKPVADQPATAHNGNAALVTSEQAQPKQADKDWNEKDSHFMPPTVTPETKAPVAEAKPNPKAGEKKDEKADEPLFSVTTRVGYTEGSTTSGDDTRGTGETINITTAKPIPLTDDKKLTLKPMLEGSAVQSESISPTGKVTDTSFKVAAGKLDLNYKITDKTSVYTEAYGEAVYSDNGPHPKDSPLGMDRYTVLGGVGVKHSQTITKEVTLDVNPRVRMAHSQNFLKPGKDGITDTVRPELATSLSYKPEAVPGLKVSLDGFGQIRHDIDRGTTKGIATIGSTMTYSINKDIDLSLKGQYGVGGTSILPEGSPTVGDANKDAFAIFGGINIKF